MHPWPEQNKAHEDFLTTVEVKIMGDLVTFKVQNFLKNSRSYNRNDQLCKVQPKSAKRV